MVQDIRIIYPNATETSGGGSVLSDRVTVPAASVPFLHLTPIPIVAAAPAGMYWEVISMHGWLDFNSLDYGGALGNRLSIRHVGEVPGLFIGIPGGGGAGFATSGADRHQVHQPAAIANPIAGVGLEVFIGGAGSWTGGDSDINVRVSYSLQTLEF